MRLTPSWTWTQGKAQKTAAGRDTHAQGDRVKQRRGREQPESTPGGAGAEGAGKPLPQAGDQGPKRAGRPATGQLEGTCRALRFRQG